MNKKTDDRIRWTLRDTLRGKSSTILVVGTALLLIAVIILDIIYLNDPQQSTNPFDMLRNFLSLKPGIVARNITIWFMAFVPLLLVLWIPLAALLTALLNTRDKKLSCTEVNMKLHRVDASRAWTWPWSMMVGCIDFTAAYFIYELAAKAICDFLQVELPAVITVLVTLTLLVFAEHRVNQISTRFSMTLVGNRETIKALLEGIFDPIIPSKYRNELGRARIATVIRLGVMRTPRLAALVVSGLDFRGRVKHFSAFLNSIIHGILTALTFGLAARTCNEVGAVENTFAKGNNAEYIDKLNNEQVQKPQLFVEICALVICIAYAISNYISYAQTGSFLFVSFL